ncbi:MAG: DUF945 family protein [Gammaproteobacteria bacterium]|nr:DUF945 family protein [Gammaproteobacteria bacterium]MDP2347280.1 DUF945 family protein [Gammaproteobacteria bacterium]
MKKLLVLLGGVIVTILTISPKLLGLMIQDDSTETRLIEMTGQPGLSLAMQSGWFSSQGQITIRDPIIAGNMYRGVVLVADLAVLHGPLLVTDDGMKLGMAWARILPVISGLAANDPIQQLLAEDMQTSFTVLAGLDGSLQLHMDAGALQFAEAGTYLYLDDLRADLHIAANGNAELRASSSEITVGDALNDTVIRNASMTLHTEELSATPLPGGLGVRATQLQSNGLQQLTMNGISIDYVARPEPDTRTITLQQNVQIDEIVSSMPIDSLTLTSEFTGIDENIAAGYIAFMRETQGRMQLMSETQLQNHVAQHSEQLVLELIRSPLQQRGNVIMQAFGGEHRAALDIEWPGMDGLSSLSGIDVRQVIRVIDVTLDIVADEEALSRSPIAASVRAYVMQGMLPQDNGNVLLNASLRGSVLVVNGQRFPLEALLN